MRETGDLAASRSAGAASYMKSGRLGKGVRWFSRGGSGWDGNLTGEAHRGVVRRGPMTDTSDRKGVLVGYVRLRLVPNSKGGERC